MRLRMVLWRCLAAALVSGLLGALGCSPLGPDEVTTGQSASAISFGLTSDMVSAGTAVCNDVWSNNHAVLQGKCIELQTALSSETGSLPVWDFGRYLAAMLEIPGQEVSLKNKQSFVHAALAILDQQYSHNGTDYSSGLGATSSTDTRYYDDNGWAGQILIKMSTWSGVDTSSKASGLWTFVRTGDSYLSGKDASSYNNVPWGGLWWNTDKVNRGLVTNETCALFGLQEDSASTAPSQWRDWVMQNLQVDSVRSDESVRCGGNSPTGLFFDHIKPDACFSNNCRKDDLWDFSCDGDPQNSCPAEGSCESPDMALTYGYGLAMAVERRLGNGLYTLAIADAADSIFPLSELENECPPFVAVYFQHLEDVDAYLGADFEGEVRYKSYATQWLTGGNWDTATNPATYHQGGCGSRTIAEAGALQFLVDGVFHSNADLGWGL